MKILFIAFILLCSWANINAQDVIASSGKDISNNNVKLSFTIGEPLVSKINNSNISLSNGFQNATNITVTSISQALFMQDEIKIYPNPSRAQLFIENKSSKESLSYTLFSLTGQEIITIQSYKQSLQLIDISKVPGGTYILTIKDKESSLTQSFKIEKINL